VDAGAGLRAMRCFLHDCAQELVRQGEEPASAPAASYHGWRRRCLLTQCGVVHHGHPWISHGLALFDEIKKQGIAPSVATYNSIISFWCKANSIEKAEAILQQMVDNGVTPDDTTFGTMMLGYSKVGQWKEVDRMFNAMTSQGRYPNLTTCNIYMAPVCKQGSGKDAREICKWPET
jgi:pentatricopeptide repeat protein